MEFVWDALKDSLILLPFLLIAYIAIEVIEYVSASHLEHSKLLTGKFSTLFGASFGLIPQCGFSVVATDLFAEKKIKIGTLIAVYIATSDEAIPLLLMNPDKCLSLIPLLLIKFVVAILVGYSIDLVFKKYNEKRLASSLPLASPTTETIKAVDEKETSEAKSDNEHEHEHGEHEDEHEHSSEHYKGCCGHEIEIDTKGAKAKKFLLHPLIHTLKIFAFILVVNLAFGGLIALIGEEKLMSFLSSSYHFAPLIACLIGLIPNCASSVVITQLYAMNGISFGACIAGLIVNAGISIVILFKQNKNIKENFAILASMVGIGLVTGYIIQLIQLAL